MTDIGVVSFGYRPPRSDGEPIVNIPAMCWGM
jgi:hypothetical protein